MQFPEDVIADKLTVEFVKTDESRPVSARLRVKGCFEPVTTPASAGTTPATMSSVTATTPKKCEEKNGMDDPVYTPSLVASSNVNESDNARPSSEQPWTSDETDESPSLTVEFNRPGTPISQVDVTDTANVAAVKVTFEPNDSNANKVRFRTMICSFL